DRCKNRQVGSCISNGCTRESNSRNARGETMRRIITATVQNSSCVVHPVTALLSGRVVLIDSITVGKSVTEGIAQMTLLMDVDEGQKIEQLTKHVHKQIDVLKVNDITDTNKVARELCLIKVVATPQSRSEINGIVEPFRARILDISKDSLIVEVTGKPDKIE